MNYLTSQHLRNIGTSLQIEPEVLDRAVLIHRRVTSQNTKRAVVFTMSHLAHLTGVHYNYLRMCIGDPGLLSYREFFIKKSTSGRTKGKKSPSRTMRRISVPAPMLMLVQRWILHRILHTAAGHEASVAFHKEADIKKAAKLHCGCKWLIKLDVRDFFESISEEKVFKVFSGLGYPRLLSFELTRLCTKVLDPGKRIASQNTRLANVQRGPYEDDLFTDQRIPRRQRLDADVLTHRRVLPQGAPTSPLLANLAVFDMDEEIMEIAARHGMVFTRYADDIALSTKRTDFTRDEASKVIGKVYAAFEKAGLIPHPGKACVRTPGALKIVLGLVVNGSEPRLTREYRNKLRLHAYMLGTRGILPSEHAKALGFKSILSMRRHIFGKLEHAKRIEPEFANKIDITLKGVNWLL
ncbi:reverse transcriptase family protein [Rhizobium gallicum]|uniref:reverse transcriptase family protein n=1 Tax=Rhizobium gallicum TaxID=56730 RepID=UPI001EF78961|nr:reverse transcriptase family protein [Rhizobium gallicum]ULJ75885.1 reverse transcriptase family protein [Rhizobium gallicum]